MTEKDKARFKTINEAISKIASGEWVPRTVIERSNGMVTMRSYIEEVPKILRKSP